MVIAAVLSGHSGESFLLLLLLLALAVPLGLRRNEVAAIAQVHITPPGQEQALDQFKLSNTPNN